MPTRQAIARSAPLPTWFVLLGILLVAGNLRTAITTVGPLLPEIEHEVGLSSFAASALISLPLLAFATVSPLAPRLARFAGLERTIVGALAVLIIGLVVRSLAPTPALWVGTVLLGIGITLMNVLLPALIKRDFPTRIGQITGTYSAVQAGFAAIASGIAVPVAGLTALGWRLPMAMWAGLALIAIGAMLPQLRGNAATFDAPRSRAEDKTTEQAVTGPATAGAPVIDAARPRSPWGSALAWQVTVFMGLQSVIFFVMVTWLPTIETDAGIDRALAGLHQFILNASGIIGSLACSALIPRLRDQRAIAAAMAMLMLIGTSGVLVNPHLGFVWAPLIGIACGACIVLALSFFGLRTRHHTQAAALSGMAQSIGYLLAAAGPIALGAIHDLTHSWRPALIVLLVAEVIILITGVLAGRDRTID